MIKLDISVALFLYLFSTVIVTFFLWIWLERKSNLSFFRLRQEHAWQCSVCSYVYMDPKDEDFSRCPRCNSINQKARVNDKEVHGT